MKLPPAQTTVPCSHLDHHPHLARHKLAPYVVCDTQHLAEVDLEQLLRVTYDNFCEV
jgi:hypothetical protein